MSTLRDQLLSKRDQSNAEVAKLDKMGFEGFLSSKDAIRKRNRMLRVEDRLWSLSSRTSPAVLELEQQLAESLPDTMSRGGKGIFGKGAGYKGRRNTLLM